MTPEFAAILGFFNQSDVEFVAFRPGLEDITAAQSCTRRLRALLEEVAQLARHEERSAIYIAKLEGQLAAAENFRSGAMEVMKDAVVATRELTVEVRHLVETTGAKR